MASIPRFMSVFVSRIQPVSPPLRIGCARGRVEVLDVEQRRDAGVLVLGLDAEEADPHPVDVAALAQEVPPAQRQQPPVHPAQRLVDVGDGDRRADRLAVDLGDHEPVARRRRAGAPARRRRGRPGVNGTKPQFFRHAPVVDLGEDVEVLAQRAPRHPPDRHAVLVARLVGELEHDRQHVLAVLDVERPHVEVHRLRQARPPRSALA